MFKKIMRSKVLAYLIFYGWNLCFVVLALTIESTEPVFREILWSFFQGTLPLSYLLCTLILLVLPLVSIIMGFTVFLHQPKQLLRWFYGVEVPILVLTLFRTFGFKQLPLHSTIWFAIIALAITAYAISILVKNFKRKYINLFFSALQMYAGLFLLSLLLLIFIPLGAIFIEEIFTTTWWRDFDLSFLFEGSFIVLLGFVFMLLTGTLFIVSPIAYFRFYLWENALLLRSNFVKKQNVYAFIAGLAVVLFVAFPYKQSQLKAFEVVEKWEQGNLENAVILRNESFIKKGLINAYLQRYRYPLSSTNTLFEDLYQEAFNSEADKADAVAYFVLSPFVYQGAGADVEKADNAFENLFDVATERAEMDVIVDAKSATSSPWRVRDDILTVKEEQVLVTHRDAEAKEKKPGWVTLTLHERYINQTRANQEVFYYFSLPSGAVCTGMWLSDTDSNLRKYAYAVSPRGAAQQVYQEEKRARRDPSLLEQVGPYQYRLRVFPIPAKPFVSFKNRNKHKQAAQPMHITLEILCKSNALGNIELPKLNEKRNVYWNEKESGLNEKEWFTVETSGYSPAMESDSVLIGNALAKRISLETLPIKNLTENITVLIDGSYSMGENLNQVKEIFENWKYNAQSVFYLANGSKAIKINKVADLDKNQFLGLNIDLPMLKAVAKKLPSNRILYITDNGSYELLSDTTDYKRFEANQPIDVLHLTGWAPIYEDVFMESVIRSGGNFYTSLKNWELAVQATFDKTITHFIDDAVLYTFKPIDNALDSNISYPSSPLWAHHYAMALSREGTQLDTVLLDKIHDIAVQNHFVSPFSSMICLVNDRQKERLEELSGKGDRFKRETETGNDGLNLMNVKGTPEPHEWALIVGALGFLLFLYRKKWLHLLPRFY